MSDPRADIVRMALVRLLRRCADSLSEMSDEEIDAIVSGELDLNLSFVRKKPPPPKKQPALLDEPRLTELSIRLRALPSREAGDRLLEDNAPTRSALEVVARYLDVPVRKEDRAEDLRRRIIEATIGFRLGSAAIQGSQMRRDARETERPSPQGTSRTKR